MDEAEVEHLVGLVEDEDFELAKVERALVDEVEQAAGRGDEDVEAAGDFAHALVVGDAAEDGADREAHDWRRRRGAGGDLRCELAGRGEDEHADLAGPRDVRRSAARRSSDGSTKAAVLPVPVWAMPSRSRPERTVGMACAWIGVGVRVILRRERVEQGLARARGCEIGQLKIQYAKRMAAP